MQNRETSEVFKTQPTGNMRATNYRYMPLIRMACTCIGNGDQNVDEMIKNVKNGYYISNMKIPSIDMKRYNWNISCQYAQKIEKWRNYRFTKGRNCHGNSTRIFLIQLMHVEMILQ